MSDLGLAAKHQAAASKEQENHPPISGVWEKRDSELLQVLLGSYPSIPPKPVLDSMYNAGRFWKRSTRRVVSMDIDPKHKTMIVGNNRKMESIPDPVFGTVVCDPPYAGPQSRDKVRKRFDENFGATASCG